MNLEPLDNGIIFTFEDDTKNGEFRDVSTGGIILGFRHDLSSQSSRWATVESIGRDVTALQVGMRVYIEALMWTQGFIHEGVEYWKTDESKVLLVDD